MPDGDGLRPLESLLVRCPCGADSRLWTTTQHSRAHAGTHTPTAAPQNQHSPHSSALFLFFFHIQLTCVISRNSDTFRTLSTPQHHPVPSSRPSSLPLQSSHTSVLSACGDLPALPVMILSVRLVSCQTHRIHPGLLPMLTLMFLRFTRKEENGAALALLSTNALV